MIAAALVATAALVALGCVALSWAYFARVSAAAPPVVGELALALKRVPRDERIEALARLAPPSTWPHQAAVAMLEATGDSGKVAALNEVLATLEHDLVARAQWPAAAVRVALLGSALPAVVAFLLDELRAAPALLAVGLTGAVAAAEIGRRASRLARRARTEADALALTLAGHLEPTATSVRERRRRGPRGRPPH